MRKNLLYRGGVMVILTIFIVSSLAQAVVFKNSLRNGIGNAHSGTMWEDDFLDESGIDITKSYNYIVDKTQGIVKMKDTYQAWYNPDWNRMKIIDVYNGGVETYQDYVLDMVVYYDSDMQSDFDDLRFTDEIGNDLYYWLGERIEGEQVNVLVRIPELPLGHTYVSMFYGNSSAEDNSNFDMIFTWDDRTDPDIMISYKNYLEGAWDPDVAFGGGHFLVAWEERLGPEDLPLDMERSIFSYIHGRAYDDDGGNPMPTGDNDIDIQVGEDYHAENPSIAYGSGKFLVVWEENPATIVDRYKADIKGAFVTISGENITISDHMTICDAPDLQVDPCVAYDSSSNRFFVVWEDARDSTNNYDVYGRLVGSTGPIGSDFQVAAGANCQDEPWICSDGSGTFMVVYEDGLNPETGPFGLKAQRYDSYGNKVGSTITIATGSSSVDNIFPAVSYCDNTERYFFAWNDADLSSGDWRGNIWGKILDKFGNTVHDNFMIQPGYNYIRTDLVPYLETMFFVGYDGVSDLWGKLVDSDGVVQTNEHMLSDGSSQSVDWNNLAVGNGKIMAVWEDERDQASEYADAFGSVWQIYRSTGSEDVHYNIGEEKQMITEAVVISKVISPSGLEEWEEFDADYTTPIGNIRFDILNVDATQIILSDINPGRDISSITQDAIRLKATFQRINPSDTPVLDKWGVSYVAYDTEPPWTEYEIIPSSPNGENDWYTVTVEFTLYPHDDVSTPEEIITYYKINGGSTEIYSDSNKPKIYSEDIYNTIEFWSVDAAENEESPHNMIGDIKIDKTKPTVTIVTPAWGVVEKGDVEVSGTIYESSQGSGVQKVEIYLNGGKIPDEEIDLSVNKDYFEWHFTAEGSSWIIKDIISHQYEIEVRAYDNAGNIGNSYVTIYTLKSRDYNPFFYNFIQKILEMPFFSRLFKSSMISLF